MDILAPMWCFYTIPFAKNSEKDDIVPLWATDLSGCQWCEPPISWHRFLEDPHSDRQLKVSNVQGVEQTWRFDKKLRIPRAEGNLGNKKEYDWGRHADVCQDFFVNIDVCCDGVPESSFFLSLD